MWWHCGHDDVTGYRFEIQYVLLGQSDDLHPESKASVSCCALCTMRRISAGAPKAGKEAVNGTE